MARIRVEALTPAPFLGGPQECYVLRHKGGWTGQTVWSMHSEKDDRFLMAAVKRSGKGTSNYLIAAERDPGDRASSRVLGKVRSDFMGELFTVYDHGMAPEDAVAESSVRRELACVGFDWDRMGPGKVSVAVPRVTDAGRSSVLRPRVGEEGLALAAAEGRPHVMLLRNKKPRWDDDLKGHVLNFRGRVTRSSVKNFQLSSDEADDRTILQFGRVGEDRFSLDYEWPLSPLQAFGIVIATLDFKIADTAAWTALQHGLASITGTGAAAASSSSSASASAAPDDPRKWFLEWKRKAEEKK